MVLLWFRATAAWMQGRGYHDTAHLAHARTLFPNDAHILFLSGSQHETFAAPFIQAPAHAAALSAGYRFDVGSAGAELREAERFLRRALTQDPDLAEARVRLGRVLVLRGRHQDAADTLRQVGTDAGDGLMRYYGMLLLGAAEEGVGNHEGAAASYAMAAAQYPAAQSPLLALSALAWRRGERDAALTQIQRVFDLPAGAEREDPWWTYHVAHWRNADQLLAELRRPFLEPQP
jgi:tetratricopeptide (TPR) repeat protein